MLRRIVSSGCTAALLVVTGSCGDLFTFRSCERGHFVEVYFDPFTTAQVLYPDDKPILRAGYSTGNRNMRGENCSKGVYSSQTAAGKFDWESTNPAVIAVSGGQLTAKQVGTATIRVRTEKSVDSVRLTVGPRVVSIRVTATPAIAKLGDTVSIVAEPLDAAGNLVTGAVLYSLSKSQPYPDTPWLPGATVTAGRFVMASTATVIVTSTAPHAVAPEARGSVKINPPS